MTQANRNSLPVTQSDDTQRAPRLLTLVLLSGLAMLSLNMFLPSLPRIATEFDISYAMASLSVGGYLALTAVVQLVMGPLSDRFGRRPIVLTAMAIFTAASLGCVLAADFTTFLMFRLMQCAVAAGIALTPAIIRDTHAASESASKIAYVTMAWALAPMLAPLLGGVLDQHFGWRASFVAMAVMGALVLAVSLVDLVETNLRKSTTFMAQIRAYPALLMDGRLWGFAICMAFSVGAFYVFITGTPLVAQKLFDLSPMQLGLCIGSITAGFVAGNFLSGRYSKRFEVTTMMIAGRVVALTGLTAGMVFALTGELGVWTLFSATVFVGIGNGLTLPGSHAGAISVQPKLAGSIAGITSAVMVLSGALLTSLTGVLVGARGDAKMLLALMLGCVLVALIAALQVRHKDRERAET